MEKRTTASDKPSATRTLNTRATEAGTKRYAARWQHTFVEDFYRVSRSRLSVSSLALGTYLGDSDDATDAMYAAAARRAGYERAFALWRRSRDPYAVPRLDLYRRHTPVRALLRLCG